MLAAFVLSIVKLFILTKEATRFSVSIHSYCYYEQGFTKEALLDNWSKITYNLTFFGKLSPRSKQPGLQLKTQVKIATKVLLEL